MALLPSGVSSGKGAPGKEAMTEKAESGLELSGANANGQRRWPLLCEDPPTSCPRAERQAHHACPSSATSFLGPHMGWVGFFLLNEQEREPTEPHLLPESFPGALEKDLRRHAPGTQVGGARQEGSSH